MRNGQGFFKNHWLRAAALLFSTIVGAGIFGIPFVFSRLGIVLGSLMLLGVGIIMWCVHRLVGELVIATRKHLQLTGFVRAMCGPTTAWIMAGVFLLLHLGAMVAYLIGEGQSLAALFGGVPLYWSLAFFCCGTFIVGRGVRTITAIDGVIGLGIIAVIIGVVILAVRNTGVVLWLPTGDFSLFTAYGVFLFALHGTSAMPGMELITGSGSLDLRKAINLGSLVPVLLYFLFATSVVVITGQETTQIATIGLGNFLGRWVVIAGNVFAIFAMGASFITIGQALVTTFQWDFGVVKWRAVLYAVGLPLVVFLAGARSFIFVVSFVGAIAGTVEIALLVWSYQRLHTRAHS